jgi:branched-chain amino acid transport system substrate-binding protein
MRKKAELLHVFAFLLITVMILGSISGCSKPEQTMQTDKKEPLKIGLVTPVTGSAAAYGETIVNSAKLAVEEINVAGGVDGKYTLELIIEDDEGTPAKSVNAAQKLINQDKIKVLIGAQASSCTLAVMEVTSAAGIPQIAPASTALSIVQLGNEWIFRNAAADTLQTSQVLKFAKDSFNVKSVAVLNEATDYGTGGATLIEQYADEMGIEVKAVESYNTGDTDFSVQLTKIAATKPDAVLVWGFYSEGALILKQAKQYGIDVPFMGGTGWASPMLVELAKEAAEGIYFSTPFSPSNPAENVQSYVKKYEEKFNGSPDFNGAQTYDSVYIIKKAVEEVKSIDSKDIRDAIRNFDEGLKGVSGVIKFDKTGEVIKDVNIVTVKNGQHEVVK